MMMTIKARPIKLVRMNKVQMMSRYLSQRISTLLLQLQRQKNPMKMTVRAVIYSVLYTFHLSFRYSSLTKVEQSQYFFIFR